MSNSNNAALGSNSSSSSSDEDILAVQCGYMLPLLQSRLLATPPNQHHDPSPSAIDIGIPNNGDAVPPFHLLDVGCGSGVLTRALAAHLTLHHPNTHVTGVDISAAILVSARIRAEAEGLGNVRFLRADVLGSWAKDGDDDDDYGDGDGDGDGGKKKIKKQKGKGRGMGKLGELFGGLKGKKGLSRSKEEEEEGEEEGGGKAGGLPFERASFDVVHCHQVLAHVSRPVDAIREMMRVVRRRESPPSTCTAIAGSNGDPNLHQTLHLGGLICLREGDLTTARVLPRSPLLEECFDLIRAIHKNQGGEPAAGEFLADWTREALQREEVEMMMMTTAVPSKKSILKPSKRRHSTIMSSTTTPTTIVTATRKVWHGGATRADREAYGRHWPGRCLQGVFYEEAVAMGVER
jgi:SAM-dependent methyltransferase